VVSGLALGVDGAAHEGALLAEEGAANGLANPHAVRTVAVVGTGLDRVYPKQHFDLAHRIAARGVLVSEYPLGMPPLSNNFPRRNRIIAGLSRATLVVEAALKSGSLITARLASEQGRDVFAIPGSIHAAQSRGCHALIKQGAKLVECAQDVLEEFDGRGGVAAMQQTDTTKVIAVSAYSTGTNSSKTTDENVKTTLESAVLTALGFDPTGLDALQARTGLPTAQLQGELLELELDGHVARLPGGLFQRLGRA
jgi:DNA processing protein